MQKCRNAETTVLVVWEGSIAFPLEPRELGSLKTPRLARPGSYGKLGVRGTAAALNLQQKPSCLFNH